MTTESKVPRRWLSPEEAADYLGLQPKTVRRMIARGDLTGYRLGKKLLRIDASELDRALTQVPSAKSGGGVAVR